jgi:hypothetical protein
VRIDGRETYFEWINAGRYSCQGERGTMEALRAGTMRSIALNQLEGLISFPSFHTAAALIFIWTLHAVRYVGWAGIPLNLALIVATPTVGAHYFIDVVGGIVVAFAAIAASRLLCRRAPRRRRSVRTAALPRICCWVVKSIHPKPSRPPGLIHRVRGVES